MSRPVLVVDDNEENRQLMAELLSLEGYTVATACTGQEALKILPEERPFVVLLDLEMPVMDGLAFRRQQLRLAPPLRSIPVIVCSGSDKAQRIIPELDPFATLSKPLPTFDPLLKYLEAAYQLAE
jgi:CheY-like chemotaxis protein